MNNDEMTYKFAAAIFVEVVATTFLRETVSDTSQTVLRLKGCLASGEDESL